MANETQLRENAEMSDVAPPMSSQRPLIYRQFLWTRITHWLWAICLFFLLFSGLQIFNARPDLYIGKQSGFGFDNAILRFSAENTDNGPKGYTTLFGKKFDTTGVFGLSGSGDDVTARGFPAWATIPSYQDLGTGRVIHFFFAWILVFTLLVWLISSLVTGHLRRDLVPGTKDLKRIPTDVANHVRLKFHHTRDYNVLQKLSYAGVLFILLPLMILTGLTMSPGMDSRLPFLLDLFGGRQTARTIHFTIMLLLVLFFVIHILMVLAAGPLNELRSIITGWYRTDPPVRESRLKRENNIMAKFKLSRRGFLTSATIGASGVALSGCDWFDSSLQDDRVRDFIAGANHLTYRAQRFLLGRDTLAPEYSKSDIRQPMRPNGSTDPEDDAYKALVSSNFADYKFEITGMVEKPVSFTLDELHNMPSRTQITRHDCVEGWSCIAQWTGVPLGHLLDQAKVKPEARYVVFKCLDTIEQSLAGDIKYYESIDLIDARHPQTIMAYGLNGKALPVSNGAPLRCRVERQLGYKMAKYVKSIELTDSIAQFGQGKGGYWEDNGYDWYGGI